MDRGIINEVKDAYLPPIEDREWKPIINNHLEKHVCKGSLPAQLFWELVCISQIIDNCLAILDKLVLPGVLGHNHEVGHQRVWSIWQNHSFENLRISPYILEWDGVVAQVGPDSINDGRLFSDVSLK